MKATDLLKRQQNCIRALVAEVGAGRSAALVQLSRLLTAQTVTERELFYPAVLHVAENEVLDAFDKQVLAERAVRRALAARVTGKVFQSRVAILEVAVGSFVEAEARALFPCVDGKVPVRRLEALGEQMEQRFLALSRGLSQNDYRTPLRRARATQLTRIVRARNVHARWPTQRQDLKNPSRQQGGSVGARTLDQYYRRVA